MNTVFEESKIFLLNLEVMASSLLCPSAEAAICCFMSFTDSGIFSFLWWFKACLHSSCGDSSCASLRLRVLGGLMQTC